MVRDIHGLYRMRSTPSFHQNQMVSPPPDMPLPPMSTMRGPFGRSQMAPPIMAEPQSIDALIDRAGGLGLTNDYNDAYGSYLRQLESLRSQFFLDGRMPMPGQPQGQSMQQQSQQQQPHNMTHNHQHQETLRTPFAFSGPFPSQQHPSSTVRHSSPEKATAENARKYGKPFCDFLTENPTVFHAVEYFANRLHQNGFRKLSERDAWKLERGGKYFVERNGSSLIAFVVGDKYEAGNGAAILAGHVDALSAKLKPVSTKPTKAGYLQLGVAPYAGALNTTWLDRDLGVGGRVLVKEGDKIVSKLVKLDHPIGVIPTLAPHFGAVSAPPYNPETQMVPIIGLESGSSTPATPDPQAPKSSFAATQPPRLVRAIAQKLGIKDNQLGNIINWELELFSFQPATFLGIDRDMITAGRIDDKLCSWSALEALINSADYDTESSGIIKVAGLFDDEEIGSLLRQGARGNFLPLVLGRTVESLNGQKAGSDLMGRTFANSFLVSSDVCHATNPNFMSTYLEGHMPELNVGVVVSSDSNGHMTTDSVSTALFQQCTEKVGAKLQSFQIRNDSRSGGTVGPMMSSATGIRAIDVGIPQLAMHSIRATTGSLDPGLGVIAFEAFLTNYEAVDREFRRD